jgi:hypothetical protein
MADFSLSSFAAAVKRQASGKKIQKPGTSTLTIDEVKAIGLDPDKFKGKKGISRDDLSPNLIKKLEAERGKFFPGS